MMKQVSGCGLLAASVAGLAAAAAGARPGLVASPAAWRTQVSVDPTGAVGLAATTLLWLLIGVVALGVATTLLGRLPGAVGAAFDAVSRRLLPATLRRAVHLMVGVTVGMTALAPAGAWASTTAVAPRPAVTLPTPLPGLGEPAGPVHLPAAHSPLPQVAGPPTGSVTASAGPTESPSSLGTTGPDPTLATALAEPPTPAAEATGSTAAPARATPQATSTSMPSLPPAKSPASAAPPATRASSPSPAAAVAPSPGPASTAAPASTTPSPPAATGDANGTAVVVSPGDSLWALAARQLAAEDAGRTPDAGSIAAEWPRWWAANRAAIGADPDLLLPGERLRPPA